MYPVRGVKVAVFPRFPKQKAGKKEVETEKVYCRLK
jgi:hypothetical protein